ncbi:MAG: hypothetical protein WC839_00145 [Candidatus Paceibacterota bacterium]
MTKEEYDSLPSPFVRIEDKNVSCKGDYSFIKIIIVYLKTKIIFYRKDHIIFYTIMTILIGSYLEIIISNLLPILEILGVGVSILFFIFLYWFLNKKPLKKKQI